MSSGKAYFSTGAPQHAPRRALYVVEGDKMAGEDRANVRVGALSDLADELRAGEALHVENHGRQRVARGPVERGGARPRRTCRWSTPRATCTTSRPPARASGSSPTSPSSGSPTTRGGCTCRPASPQGQVLPRPRLARLDGGGVHRGALRVHPLVPGGQAQGVRRGRRRTRARAPRRYRSSMYREPT